MSDFKSHRIGPDDIKIVINARNLDSNATATESKFENSRFKAMIPYPDGYDDDNRYILFVHDYSKISTGIGIRVLSGGWNRKAPSWGVFELNEDSKSKIGSELVRGYWDKELH